MRTFLTMAPAALAILATAGMAGTFFGFSVGVMPGLDAARPEAAVTAMQGINQRIQNPVFLGAFLLAPVLLALTGALLWSSSRSAAVLFWAAAAVYVLGAVVPTVAVNVPMNDAIDAVANPSGPEAERAWSDYSGRWTAWNTLRAAASGAAVLLAALACHRWGRDG